MINNQESIFTQVKASLLDPYNVSIQDLDLMMSEMLSKGIDMGDIYFQEHSPIQFSKKKYPIYPQIYN